MSAYQSGGGMGGTTSENSLNRGMRPAPADIATPPPFGPVPNLSPHTYGQPTVSNNQFTNKDGPRLKSFIDLRLRAIIPSF